MSLLKFKGEKLMLKALISFGSIVYPTKVLDLTQASPIDGTPIILWEYNGAVNQRWRLVAVSS